VHYFDSDLAIRIAVRCSEVFCQNNGAKRPGTQFFDDSITILQMITFDL